MVVDPAPVGKVQGPPVTKRVQATGARAPTEVEESRRLFAKPIPGNQAQSPLGARGLDQRNPVIEMSPIVLRQEEVIVILMKGKTDYRSLEIEDLIEHGLGSGDSLGERFHPRTYSLKGFFSSHYARTQRSRLTGNRLVAKVPRRMLGFRWGGIVWAGIEFCHEEVDLFTAEKFRDNAEAPFLERGGDCFEISHKYTYSDQIQVCPGMKIGEVVIPGLPGNPGFVSIPWIPVFARMTYTQKMCQDNPNSGYYTFLNDNVLDCVTGDRPQRWKLASLGYFRAFFVFAAP